MWLFPGSHNYFVPELLLEKNNIKDYQGRILNCLIRFTGASHPFCRLHYSGSSWEEVTPVWGQLNLAINLPYSDFWTRRRWGKLSGKLFELVFEEVIVIICISVSVGGRKRKRLTSFYYPVITVLLWFKRGTTFRLASAGSQAWRDIQGAALSLEAAAQTGAARRITWEASQGEATTHSSQISVSQSVVASCVQPCHIFTVRQAWSLHQKERLFLYDQSAITNVLTHSECWLLV